MPSRGVIIDPFAILPIGERTMKKLCIVGASGKLGQYMVQHAMDRGYEIVAVCREQSVGKLGRFKGRITVIPEPRMIGRL
jgi:dihydrodipicolinate reductase